MTKLDKMMARLEMLQEEAQAYLDGEKVTEAEQKMAEIAALEKKIAIQKQLDAAAQKAIAEEDHNVHKQVGGEPDISAESKAVSDIHKTACSIRAVIKKAIGKPLTDEEKSLLLPNGSHPNGEHGEGYILPQDIRTKINSLIRDFRSFRDVIGTITTTAMTGTLTVDDVSKITGLTNFEDGSEITPSEDPEFKNVKFALAEYGTIISMSNVLLAMTDADLVNYISAYFARKAVITENTKIIEVLKKGKTPKELADYTALKSSINKDLDPASLYGTVIVTNQSGFDFLDSQLDKNGRPILQPDPTNATVKRFAGYEIKVFSNAQLKDEEDDSFPIFFGNLTEAAKFVDAGYYKFATSEHAGFTKNTTLARLVELFDVVQWDTSDACYVYGKLKAAEAEV